jgi:hypothetical protein
VVKVDSNSVPFSGQWKTTLSVGMVIEARTISDEFALIDPKHCCLPPYEGFCVKEGSILFSGFCGTESGFRWIKKRKGPVAFLDPWLIRENPVATPGQIDYVVSQTIHRQRSPSSPRFRRAGGIQSEQAFLQLSELQAWRGILSLVQSADCYRLKLGTGPTCN